MICPYVYLIYTPSDGTLSYFIREGMNEPKNTLKRLISH